MASRTDARFSTYSGAPSIHPSLAPTLETQAPSNRTSARTSQQTPYLLPHDQDAQPYSEKSHYADNNNDSNTRMPYPHTSSTAALSASTLSSSTDPKSQDLKSWSGTLQRLQDSRLDKQRYVMNDNKSDEVSKLALGAKVERALARRMTGQDAQFRRNGSGGSKKKMVLDAEKRSLEVEVAN